MPRCCAEIGRTGAWRQCPRAGVVSSLRTVRGVGGVLVLHYCARHQGRANERAPFVYIADPVHEISEMHLNGRTLEISCSAERAREIVTDAANSADAGDGRTPDRGAALALSNLASKIR